MSRDPHPFENAGSDHPGWDRKHFTHRDRDWSLLVINTLQADCSGELKSMVSDRGSRNLPEYAYWPSHHHLAVNCRLTVDAAVEIIDRAYAAFWAGRGVGDRAARHEIRKALGINA